MTFGYLNAAAWLDVTSDITTIDESALSFLLDVFAYELFEIPSAT